jgi:membrane-bound metal-dependent hydrolase YbcI (DUF457 family)
MQLGHAGLALAVAAVDPRPETFAVVFATQFLPNADSLVIRAGLARPDFHGTYSHSLVFAIMVWLGVTVMLGPWLGLLGGLSILTHIVADMPTDTGIPLLLPFSTRRFSFNLWTNTGYWGREMYAGYYRQPWARVVEGAVLVLVIGLYTGRLLAGVGPGL